MVVAANNSHSRHRHAVSTGEGPRGTAVSGRKCFGSECLNLHFVNKHEIHSILPGRQLQIDNDERPWQPYSRLAIPNKQHMTIADFAAADKRTCFLVKRLQILLL